jgi:hypothetical protein
VHFVADPTKLAELAGMYRNVLNNTVAVLRVTDGKLTIDETVELLQIGGLSFSTGDRRFNFGADGFQEVTSDGDTGYRRVQPAHPSPSELSPLAGVYTSPESGATLTVAVKGGDLMFGIGSNLPVRLRPTFRDAFMMQGTAVRFLRDADGKVIQLRVGTDRAWDLQFDRVR